MEKTNLRTIDGLCERLKDWERDSVMELWNHIENATEGVFVEPESVWFGRCMPYVSFRNSRGESAIYQMNYNGSVTSSFPYVYRNGQAETDLDTGTIQFTVKAGSKPCPFMRKIMNDFCFENEKMKSIFEASGKDHFRDVLDRWNCMIEFLGFEPRMWNKISCKDQSLLLEYSNGFWINSSRSGAITFDFEKEFYVARPGVIAGKTLSSKLFSIFGEKENGKQEQ